MQTSDMLNKAVLAAFIKLFWASLARSKIGFCAPVKTTGFDRFRKAKDRAEAVYAMVSVPCATTNPSYFVYKFFVNSLRQLLPYAGMHIGTVDIGYKLKIKIRQIINARN